MEEQTFKVTTDAATTDTEAQQLTDENSIAEKEIEIEQGAMSAAADYWAKEGMENHPDIEKALRRMGKIHYRNSSKICDVSIIRAILNEYRLMYFRYWDELGKCDENESVSMKISEDADRLYGYLETAEMNTFLRKLAYNTDSEYFILAYGRFLTAEKVPAFIKAMENKASQGAGKGRVWARNAQAALLLNDSKEAMQYFEKKKKLAEYAQVRNITEEQLRELYLTPDFGFDADGIKRYSVGDIQLCIHVLPDTSLEM